MKVVALSMLAVAARATELTQATWDAATTGKSVFVKFQAPWCGHCKSMKPDWDTLMDKFKDSKTAVIADVDCTADGKTLCEKVGVTGYPTIKYGDPNDLKDYSGERDLAGLTKFAEENLGPVCGPDSLDLCDQEQKKHIAKFQKMDIDELLEKIEESDAKLKKIETESKKVTDGLEKQIQGLQGKIRKEGEKKDKKLEKAKKETSLKYMSAVAATHKKKDEANDEKKEEEKKEEL